MPSKKVTTKKELSIPRLVIKCQRIFNKYIRLRDIGCCCISCGSDKANQAGHYFPTRHYSQIRFHPDNVHLQCAYCNGYLHGNQANYRMGLIRKIGSDQVESLESVSLTCSRTYRWAREDLMELIRTYESIIKGMEEILNGK